MFTQPSNAGRALPTSFRGIQALRGIAALMVVCDHATISWWREVSPQHSPDSPYMWLKGASGVDIFFIISGFVMVIATRGRNHGKHPALHFLERRVLRIFPMYWFVTGLFVLNIALFHLLPALPSRADVFPPLSWGHLISSLLLRPNYRSPIIEVAWTLSLECFFYLLFALTLTLRVKPLRLLVPLLVLFGTIGIFQRPSWPGITLLFSMHHFEFLAGVILGYAVAHRNRISPVVAVVMGLAGLAILCTPGLDIPATRVVAWGVPALLIVVATLALEDPLGHLWPRFMLLLGEASYSLYLSHVITVHYVCRLFEIVGLLPFGVYRLRDDILVALVSVPVATLAAIGLYLAIERPMNNTLRRLLLHEGKPRAQIV